MFINHANETAVAPTYSEAPAPLSAHRLHTTKSVWSQDRNESPIVLILTASVAVLGGLLVVATMAQAFV
jgi:hypothetical protein